MSGSPYTITLPSHCGPHASMSPYYFDPSTNQPDLYYEYGLGSSPSSSSSNVIPTPPTAQTSLLPLTWGFPVPLSTQFPTCLPNITIESEGIRKERPAAISQHRAKGQQTLPLHTTSLPQHSQTFFSPADDALLGHWAPIPPAFPAPPPPSPMLHQPRPSRRIPIVDLDKLASACETQLLQGRDGGGSEVYSPWSQQLSAGPFTPISKPGLKQRSITKEPALLCSCGCMDFL